MIEQSGEGKKKLLGRRSEELQSGFRHFFGGNSFKIRSCLVEKDMDPRVQVQTMELYGFPWCLRPRTGSSGLAFQHSCVGVFRISHVEGMEGKRQKAGGGEGKQ